MNWGFALAYWGGVVIISVFVVSIVLRIRKRWEEHNHCYNCGRIYYGKGFCPYCGPK